MTRKTFFTVIKSNQRAIMNSILEFTNRLSLVARGVTALNHSLHDVGDYKWSSKAADYNGWLICDGRSLDRTEFNKLFEVIGTVFGSSDSNTFNLPDARGRVMAAVGTEPHQAIGSVVGAEAIQISASNMPAHAHVGVTDAEGDHSHTTGVSSAGAHTHSTNATGGSLGLAVSDGTNTVSSVDASANELNVWTTPQALTVNSGGDHIHAVTIGSNGLHVHGFATSIEGQNDPFSIMQPTLYGGNLFIYAGTIIV